jgi:MGT family glycosyltransferase
MTRRLFDRGLPAFNATRRGLGLAPVSSVLDHAVSGDRILLLTSRAFEFPQFSPPANVRFVGPRLEDPAWAGDWSAPPGDSPLVLVGLSTTFMDQRATLQRIAAALGELDVRAVMTTGPAVAPADVEASPNVTVVESAPHALVLRDAAAVVTHGGHGTMIKALAAGVPVVAIPMGRDQLDNAARLVACGAGVRVPGRARAGRIARAVRSVLEQPDYAAQAGRLADVIHDELRTDRAVAELEALVPSKQITPSG